MWQWQEELIVCTYIYSPLKQDKNGSFSVPVRVHLTAGKLDFYDMNKSKDSVIHPHIISSRESTSQQKQSIMEILSFFSTAGPRMEVSVDLHTPSGCMLIHATLSGQYCTRAEVFPTMRFYYAYQRAEDDSLEMRLARGLDTSGKMSMSASTECMQFELCDDRSDGCVLRMEALCFSVAMKTWRLCKSGQRVSVFEDIEINPIKTSSKSSKLSQNSVHSDQDFSL